ncbi:osmoprotectant NAGGN system M42 family peptidase [Solwaraspora sp. WMMD1047]|uniref:osmoprotectant NAGGN system M42 family peptidase n=1 Tax=Solwaraspora sp. WMMD1047 TaxID=3016102 RepID=UPI0024168378|nr:osmoprotectant NAGGN system M42 family peptidase [Solwaraspora sp. WMMD1047]MDG4830858.1 osmoprotectant NAGGN system M42 family peptidase [Solwaraspora sp. WMMD1047]
MTPRAPEPLKLDLEYLRQVLLELLDIPSPSGRTDHVMQYVGERLDALGIPFTVTRRGALSASLPGPRNTGADRAVVVHTDTIGGMVKRLKENGRLELKPIGTHSARFAEGAYVRIFTDDLERVLTGQVLPLKASGHRYNDDVDLQGVGWEQVEVRVDERVDDIAGLRALGVDVGDFVAILPQPSITPSGYVRSRHLDDKAGVAAVLTAFKAMVDAGLQPPVTAHLLITCTEEIGHGASHGLDPDVAEIVSVDAAVVAPGQQSREDAAVVAMGDGVGPFDYHLTRKLANLAAEHGVELVRDVFDYYRSDVAAALEAGAHARVALLGFGVDATHGHERTHLDGLRHLAQLTCLYLQSDLVFPEWDAEPGGELADFPSLSVQPANEDGPRDGPIGVS